jgi:hypothetical protein
MLPQIIIKIIVIIFLIRKIKLIVIQFTIILMLLCPHGLQSGLRQTFAVARSIPTQHYPLLQLPKPQWSPKMCPLQSKYHLHARTLPGFYTFHSSAAVVFFVQSLRVTNLPNPACLLHH